MTKLKPFSGRVRQNIKNCLNQNLVIASLFENGFEATSSSKTNLLSVGKDFSVFCIFLIEEVEAIFWKREAKHNNLVKSKFGHRKLLRKCFRSYLELTYECSKRSKRSFFSFLHVFEWRSWDRFLGKQDRALNTFKFKFGHRKLLRKCFEATLRLKTISWAFQKGIFQFFVNFWLTKLKSFSWKVSQNIRNCVNQNLVIGSTIENAFEATLTSKTNVLSIPNGHFSVFLKFLNDKAEPALWESKKEPQRSFKFKVDDRNLSKKWFWSYLELKSKCPGRLKRVFFDFLQIFNSGSWNHFLGKWGKT